MVRCLVQFAVLIYATKVFAQGEPEPQELPYVISEGQYFEVEDRNFSIKAPMGWEVYRNMNGATIFMQAPKEEGLIYQRNIRIMAFNGPEFIDDMTFEEYEKEIVENSTKMSNAVVDYRIRNRTTIELANGIPAGLFYAEFVIDEIPMMQMHILASSAEHHFVLTYTDLMEHFEMDNSPYLVEAFNALQSTELGSPPPSRNLSMILIGGGLVAVLALFIVIKLIRSKKVKALAEGLDEYGEDEDFAEGTDPMESHIDSALSDLKSKNQKKLKKKEKLKARKAKDDDELDDESDRVEPYEDELTSSVETLATTPLEADDHSINPPPPPQALNREPLVPQAPVTPPPPPRPQVAPKDPHSSSGQMPLPPPPVKKAEVDTGSWQAEQDDESDLGELTLGRSKKKKPKNKVSRNPKSQVAESNAAVKLNDEDADFADAEDDDDGWNL